MLNFDSHNALDAIDWAGQGSLKKGTGRVKNKTTATGKGNPTDAQEKTLEANNSQQAERRSRD